MSFVLSARAERRTPIWVGGVSKWFGPVIALNDVSLQVDGGVVGLVGPNGAGKSTLLKLLTGQLRPSLGAVRVFGRSVRSPAARRRIGFSPDVDAFYEEMTGSQFVQAMMRLSGYPAAEARRRTERAIEMVGMSVAAGRVEKRLRGMSKGMRQRIKLAQAIAHDPDLLILDEPLSGLDPVGRREFSQLIREQVQRGAAVLLSSHVLTELGDLADRIVLIAEGRLILEQERSEWARPTDSRGMVVEVYSPAARRFASEAMGWSVVTAVELDEQQMDRCRIVSRDPEFVLDALARLCREVGWPISRLSTDAGLSDGLFRQVQEE